MMTAMQCSLHAKAAVCVLIMAVGVAFVSASVSSVYAYYTIWYCYYHYSNGNCYYPYYCAGGYCSYPNSPATVLMRPANRYQLTVGANPSSLSGQVTGGGSFTAGSSASFNAGQSVVQVSQDTRYVFSGWSGDYSGSGTSGSVTMNAAKTITAVYQLQYYLSVSAQPSNAPAPRGSGWFNAGDTATISTPAPNFSLSSGSKLIFSGWTVDGNTNQAGSRLALQMNAPHTVVAQYKQQYYLTVSTDQGLASGQGWYDAGSNAQISVTTPPSPSYGVNIIFDGWQGSMQSQSQSTTVQMNGPMNVTATWRTDYTVLYVTIAAILTIIGIAALTTLIITKHRNQSVPQKTNRITKT